MSRLHEQFFRPEEAAVLTDLQRHDRRKRRIALAIATAICRAHVKTHGTESEVSLYHDRKPKVHKTTVTVTVEELFE
jgi:hypothetical protein